MTHIKAFARGLLRIRRALLASAVSAAVVTLLLLMPGSAGAVSIDVTVPTPINQGATVRAFQVMTVLTLNVFDA